MKRLLLQSLAGVVALAAIVYVGDYVFLRYRMLRHQGVIGSVTVTPLYVIQQKSGKTEYDFAQPQNQPCVYSLFPHFGDTPCWYLSRHTQPQINI
jgi:hypothetical protein